MRRFLEKLGGQNMSIRHSEELAQQWRDLVAAGIPLEPLENRVGIDARNSGRALTITAGSQYRGWSEIRELRNGRFGYILSIFVRRDAPGKTIIRESWISPPWEDQTFEWLEDPKGGKHPTWYDFPGDTQQFARVEVLNHRINCVLSRGDIREGLLLGVGGDQPPAMYKNFAMVPVTFTIVDQLDYAHSTNLQMQMIRRPDRAKTIYKSKRIPIFSGADTVAPSPSLIASPGPTEEISKNDAEAMRRALEEMVRGGSKRNHGKLLIGSETG
jgi:hypothetical protein